MLNIEKKTAIEELKLQGRHCLYREKGFLMKATIEEVTLCDNSCSIELSYMSSTTNQKDRTTVGAALEHLDITQHALFACGYIAFSLIFDEKILEQLDLIFATHSSLDHYTRLRITNDAAYQYLQPIDFYLKRQEERLKDPFF